MSDEENRDSLHRQMDRLENKIDNFSENILTKISQLNDNVNRIDKTISVDKVAMDAKIDALELRIKQIESVINKPTVIDFLKEHILKIISGTIITMLLSALILGMKLQLIDAVSK